MAANWSEAEVLRLRLRDTVESVALRADFEYYPSLARYCQYSLKATVLSIASCTRNAVSYCTSHTRRDIATNTARVSPSDCGTCAHCYMQSSSLPVRGKNTLGPFFVN